MCDPVTMTALTVGSMAYTHQQQESAVKRQNKIAEEAYRNDLSQLETMRQQEQENASQDLMFLNQDALRQQASMAANNRGITGNTVDRLSNALRARQSENAMTIFQNLDRANQQNALQQRGAQTSMKGRLQSRPNRLGTALKMGIAGTQAWNAAGGMEAFGKDTNLPKTPKSPKPKGN